jgi:hypothetical protein
VVHALTAPKTFAIPLEELSELAEGMVKQAAVTATQ